MTPAQLLTDAFERVHDGGLAVVEGLSADQLAVRPGPDANPIGWLVWHLARVQDDHVAHVAGVEQVWTAGDFVTSFGLPFKPTDIGFGHTSDDVAAVRADADLLAAYLSAVHEQTLAYVDGLGPEDLDRDRQHQVGAPRDLRCSPHECGERRHPAPRPGGVRPRPPRHLASIHQWANDSWGRHPGRRGYSAIDRRCHSRSVAVRATLSLVRVQTMTNWAPMPVRLGDGGRAWISGNMWTWDSLACPCRVLFVVLLAVIVALWLLFGAHVVANLLVPILLVGLVIVGVSQLDEKPKEDLCNPPEVADAAGADTARLEIRKMALQARGDWRKARAEQRQPLSGLDARCEAPIPQNSGPTSAWQPGPG